MFSTHLLGVVVARTGARAEAETAAGDAAHSSFSAEEIWRGQESKGDAMKTFSIDSDDNISTFATAEETTEAPGLERFDSVDQFLTLAERWPISRLVEIWNSLAGVKPVKRFTDSNTAANRIWRVIQRLGPAESPAEPTPGSKAKNRRQPPRTGGSNTKTARLLVLLKRPAGASLKALMKATGWQAHSVRGFLSGHLHKKLGLRVKSFRRNGERIYLIRR
jgi:hypothetical protein